MDGAEVRSLDVVEVELVSVEVRQDVPLEELLLTVQGELFGAHGAHLPVALHVLLEAPLLEVWGEDDLAQGAAPVLVPAAAGVEAEAGPGLGAVLGRSFIRVLWGMLSAVRGAGVAAGLDTHHLLGPAWSSRAGGGGRVGGWVW